MDGSRELPLTPHQKNKPQNVPFIKKRPPHHFSPVWMWRSFVIDFATCQTIKKIIEDLEKIHPSAIFQELISLKN